MLISSGIRAGGGPYRHTGGDTFAYCVERANFGQPGQMRNLYAGSATVVSGASTANKTGIPNGYRHPGSWSMAIKNGGMSSYNLINGLGTLTAPSLIAGRNGVAALAGVGNLTATGSVLAYLIAALAGIGSIPTAALQSYLTILASLAGSGSLTATMRADGSCASALAGVGVIATATMKGLGNITCSIDPFAPVLSNEGIAEAVWARQEGTFLYALAHNKIITDPVAGTMTVYAADDVTVLYVAQLKQDAAGATPYAGAGADRREKFA